MKNITRKLATVGAIAAMALSVRTTEAHHNSTHNQNPNPPAALGPTTIIHFAAGSLIIPMDICYSRTSFASNANVTSVVTPLTYSTAKCNTTSEKDYGMIEAYSLMFRLIFDGIPVNWAIKSSKTGWNDTDFTITKAGGGPVGWRAPGSAENTNKYSALTTIKYRGAPFVIDSAYAADAITKMNTYKTAHAAYADVDYHIAKVSFDAPIYKTFTELPKLAILDLTDATTSLHQQKTSDMDDLISDAVMADLEGTLWDWVTIPEAKAGDLSDYDLAWVASFDFDQAGEPNAGQQAFVDSLAEFADDGGSVLIQDDAIGAMEGYGTMNLAGTVYTASKAGAYHFMVDNGLIANGIGAAWDNGSSTETTLSSDYSDPASQFGGDQWTGIGGSKEDWKPRYDKKYLDGVRRMIYSQHTSTDSLRRWDFATWRKKDNDADKGTIYYLGGSNWRKNTSAGFRVVLNTLLSTTPLEHGDVTEVARSSPIIATVDGTETEFAGTLEAEIPVTTAPTWASAADDGVFEFPWVKGHMRGINVATLSTGETTFDDASASILWDAADHIPTTNYSGSGCAFPADGTCRRIFTDTGSATAPAETLVVTGNHDALMTPLGVTTTANADILIGYIQKGREDGSSYVSALGGVDRSTVAVIEPSPLIPNGRTTMAYFGGVDGMLHAVCAEDGPGCPTAGVEMWAFLPSVEIGKVRLNSTRLDGSPKVADIYGRFGTSTSRSLKTVLFFQNGNQNESATYAIDITDPRSPDVLWKVSTEGPGIGVAMGWVVDNSAVTPMLFVQSALDPTGTESGYWLRAIDAATGEVRWSIEHDYPDPRISTHDDPPLTAMPGGVTILANEGGRTVDSLLVPDIYGQVYRYDPLTGDNVYGTSAMFDMGEDYHPIGASVALYHSDDTGLTHALVVTGGFADPFAPSGTMWAPDDVNQYAVGFPATTTDVPVTRTQVEADDTLGIHIDFGAGQRAFSPAVVAGGEVFITTDSSAVNSSDYGSETNTGRLWRKTLSGGTAATYTTVASGAAAVDVSVSTGTVLSGGFSSVVKTQPSGFDAAGTGMEATPSTSTSRRLWLRLR